MSMGLVKDLSRSSSHSIRMEEDFGNLSNSSVTNQAFSSPEVAAFLIVFSIPLAAIIAFNALIALVLLRSTSVAVTVRVPLINLLMAILITAMILLSQMLTTVILVLSNAAEPPLPLCRFAVWLINVTQNARLLGLVVFSVMVFQTVTCGSRKIRAKWLILSLVITWVTAALTVSYILVPVIVGVKYVEGVACYAVEQYVEYQIAQFTIIMRWIVFACFIIVPLLVCISVLLATLCYIKRHTISEGAQYKKAMAKFAAFLITGNVLNILGQVVPIVVVLVLSDLDIVGLYIFRFIITLLSFIPTPILIIVFLKPVRKGLRRLVCSKHQKDNETIPMQQADRPV